MATFIRRALRKQETIHELFFQGFGARPGTGYSFPCSPTGTVRLAELRPEGVDSLNLCLSGQAKVWPPVVESHTRRYTVPAIILCDHCARAITLDSSCANPCPDCGTAYNLYGQRLADREQWGEETGESAGDCCRGFTDDD